MCSCREKKFENDEKQNNEIEMDENIVVCIYIDCKDLKIIIHGKNYYILLKMNMNIKNRSRKNLSSIILLEKNSTPSNSL